ncbi:hypothetical protein J6590_026704 [Homalodisca vitripennis]|nr:hypothetical protein J6590_026704 [Homalodisca vitripennis]
MGRKKADREESLLKKRVAERLRREKIKKDPTLAKLQAEKQAKWNKMKKEKQKQMTNRQQRELRKKWRKKAKEAYERKKIKKQTSDENVQEDVTSCQNFDGSPPVQKLNHNKSLSATKRERHQAKTAYQRLVSENKKLAASREILQRKVRTLQMRLLRNNSGLKSESPKSVVKQVIKKKMIRRK